MEHIVTREWSGKAYAVRDLDAKRKDKPGGIMDEEGRELI
jgi:hypothetical protein